MPMPIMGGVPGPKPDELPLPPPVVEDDAVDERESERTGPPA